MVGAWHNYSERVLTGGSRTKGVAHDRYGSLDAEFFTECSSNLTHRRKIEMAKRKLYSLNTLAIETAAEISERSAVRWRT